MQAGRSAFFVSVQKRFCFSAFKRQRSWIACLLPQGCPEGLGWTGKNHPRYAPVFFLPGLAQKGNPRGRRPIKSGKHIPMGLFIHKIKDYETTDYQKDWQTCNSDIPDYRNMSADKQRDCPHRDDYAAVACRRILRFPVQDTGHYFQDSYSSVHCRIICRITQNINIHIWKQLL